MLNNSPAVQSDFAQSPVNCLFGSYPSIQELRSHYGKNAPIVWLIPQLKDLSEFCGVKDKMLNEQLQSCAKVIATEFGYLKTSELMLFFHLFKAGRYGQFYGAVDPMKITTSLRTFLVDRNDYFWRLEQRKKEKERDEWKKGAVTYEKYQELVKEGKV